MRGEIQRAYFLAAGWSLEITQKFIAERREQRARAKAFAEANGGPDAVVVSYPDAMVGFTSPVRDLDGWKQQQMQGIKEPVWVPNGRTAAGKKAKVELEKHRFMGAFVYTDRLGLKTITGRPEGGGTGLGWYAVTFEGYTFADGKKFIIIVPWSETARDEETGEPLGTVQVPKDAIRLKASEYHQIVEAWEDYRRAQKATTPAAAEER